MLLIGWQYCLSFSLLHTRGTIRMINEKKSTANRPSLILWLIGLLVFIKAPIIFSIYSILTALGLTDHSLAILLSILFGIKITNWFEELNDEVTEYIEKL